MRLCSDPIKRLTLELGGKSPNLVFADADLASAVPSAVWSIYYSAGQSCEARSRVLVERSIYDDVVSEFTEKAQTVKTGDPLDAETQMGSLISTAHRERVHSFVEGAREEGAEVTTGGEPGSGFSEAGAFYPPTVLAGVENSMTVAQEEVFGPVVTIIPFEDEKDAIRIANDVKYGLMATVWTGDPARGHRLASRIKSGTVGINVPYTAMPGPAVRRLQAVRLRARARDRDARPLPRDEERAREHRLPADQPVRPLALALPLGRPRGRHRRRRRGSPRSSSALAVLAPSLRDEYDLTLTQIGVLLAAEWVGLTLSMIPWGFAADRYGERWTLTVGLTACAACLAGAAYAPSFRALFVLLMVGGHDRRQRAVGKRPRGDALVRRLPARARARRPADGGAGRRAGGRARPAGAARPARGISLSGGDRAARRRGRRRRPPSRARARARRGRHRVDACATAGCGSSARRAGSTSSRRSR